VWLYVWLCECVNVCLCTCMCVSTVCVCGCVCVSTVCVCVHACVHTCLCAWSWRFSISGCLAFAAEGTPPGSPSGIYASETDRTYVVLSWKASAYSSKAPMWYYIEKVFIQYIYIQYIKYIPPVVCNFTSWRCCPCDTMFWVSKLIHSFLETTTPTS